MSRAADRHRSHVADLWHLMYTTITRCLALGLCLAADAFDSRQPAAVLDLSGWSLTLPIETDRAGTPDEVRQPDLASFEHPRCFHVSERGDGVVFRAHCGGPTTKGSSFPRCELREMTDGGTRRASWKTDGNVIHSLVMRAAITATPEVKPHVVCAQIHDAEDDLLMIRLEGTKLIIERNAVGDVVLETRYQLGTPFDLKIQAGAGAVDVWYNGRHSLRWAVSKAGCYFKAGCYTQSNPSKGDAPASFGEVVVHTLLVEHEPLP